MSEEVVRSVEGGKGPGEAAAEMFAGYPLLPGCRDETCSAAGELRPHWEYLASAVGALGGSELEGRAHELRRLLRENGVTYNFFENDDSVERPWSLDPIPVLLTSSDWSEIEQGLAQRAELLDLVLRDLYGPRKLLQRGLVPPELILDHPGYLRPCAGTACADARWLTLCAADLARGPELGRYAERAEALSRLLREVLLRLLAGSVRRPTARSRCCCAP